MSASSLAELRDRIDRTTYADEQETLARLLPETGLEASDGERIARSAADLVRRIRETAGPGLMEAFLAEYGLSTDEGVALMCLAEGLPRIPDAGTIDALIEDKIAPSDWSRRLGHSSSSLVNASTWALMLTGKVLEDREPGISGILHGAIRRLGEPVIRTAVTRAIKEVGRQFVLGETIQAALRRAATAEAKGYVHSYDMLGEAALTEADANRYHLAYSQAISAISEACTSDDIHRNPGISVKLSALHPRFEATQCARVIAELPPRVRSLALLAKSAGMGFNIDAEEAGRLSLSLDVIATVLADDALAGWDGFGVAVQAYGPRAGPVIDWLYGFAERFDRRITVRLVKGAYWDTEIKRAQEKGMAGFPVFTRKAATDVSYLANARKLLGMTDRLYPQFATHNAHTVAAVLDIAGGGGGGAFEFQRLHGMGERLHDIVLEENATRCRIYAPVGRHRDLLAYLVRRLLENGASSSFVHRIVDESVAPEAVTGNPLAEAERHPGASRNPALRTGAELFGPDRRNARGWDLADAPQVAAFRRAREDFAAHRFGAAPLIATDAPDGEALPVTNPANPGDHVGTVRQASAAQIAAALSSARPWAADVPTRAGVLRRAADLYEEHCGAIFALLGREAGKTPNDCVNELREAVDFLRYYAAEAERTRPSATGVFTCISPWNFPLAIFTGQVAAALAAGNAVLAKPAEWTPLIAHAATELLHRAGVPPDALQFLPGDGAGVGTALVSDPRVSGVAFTGSTETARIIRRSMARHLAPSAPLIAETGGLNAMIVDSTALPEQAVQAVVESAFQSAGQRCSALRCLYVQEDIAEHLEAMLFGAMDELQVGDPWHIPTDVGPVIDAEARAGIDAHIAAARVEGRVLKQLARPRDGHFIAPVAIRVAGIAEIEQEIFGPVLHIATFRAEEIDAVIGAINATGYGLTFGLHTRIDDRVQYVVERLRAGNIYVNRNQIGAVVGSQPFGGEGLSGTGPKAGGPHYLGRFMCAEPVVTDAAGGQADPAQVQARIGAVRAGEEALKTLVMPGPTGESNALSLIPRAPLLCLGPGAEAEAEQAGAVRALGGAAVGADGLPARALTRLAGFSGALYWGDNAHQARAYAQALAGRDGAILPLITGRPDMGHVLRERHVCVDTSATGGNAALLAAADAE